MSVALASAQLCLRQGTRPGMEDHAIALPERAIFAVADGFGGPLPGSAAARGACAAIREFLVHEAGDRDATLPFVLRQYYSLAGNILFNSLVHANRELIRYNKGKGIHERGGASALAAYLDGELLAIANAGACRASLVRAGRRTELVVPRTYGKLLDPSGDDTGDEPALGAPMVALGIVNDLEPEIFEYRVRPGDIVLLHTDGFAASALEAAAREGQADGFAARCEAIEILDDAAAVALYF